MDKDKVLLTKSGVEKLEEERDNLINVERPRVIEELQLARSQGDLSENADYDAARDKQAQIEQRIKEIEYMLQNAEIISEEQMDLNVVKPGTTVTILDLSLEDYAYYEENNKVFSGAGFVIEHFGGETISIKEVPYFLGKLDSKKLFMEILDNLKGLGSGKTSEVKLNKIASMACRSAIKANDYLNHDEMEKLIEDLRYINDPFYCPHGRPIIIKFTEYELNKKFRRII